MIFGRQLEHHFVLGVFHFHAGKTSGSPALSGQQTTTLRIDTMRTMLALLWRNNTVKMGNPLIRHYPDLRPEMGNFAAANRADCHCFCSTVTKVSFLLPPCATAIISMILNPRALPNPLVFHPNDIA